MKPFSLFRVGLAALLLPLALSTPTLAQTTPLEQAVFDAGLPAIGSPAPDFSLPDQDGKIHSLADLRGKQVVLAFYPADMTMGCTAEVCSIRDNIDQLQKTGAAVFGVSVQDVASKRQFADKEKLNFPILADVDKSVSKAYGVLNPKGYDERVTFIIGADGKIKYIDKALRFDRTSTGLMSSHAQTLVMALDPAWKAAIGSPVPSFTLANYDGRQVTSTAAQEPTVVVFLSSRCPASSKAAPELAQLYKQYGEHVRFVGVDSNAGEKPGQIEAWAKGEQVEFPIVTDPGSVVADHFAAERTPEVWVIDASGVARYHGAIQAQASAAKREYLGDAVQALLSRQPVPVAETRSAGCAIKRAHH